ncbi:MAG: NAD(P)H-binding protein [Bacteroidota bacterium]
MKPTIAIAGATGFIGRWFIHRFKDQYRFIGLTRREMLIEEPDPDVEWRQVEMYSLSSVTEALTGADYALYLVHSMNPSTRLQQGSFEDTDLLLADNFARAAEAQGLKQIVFVGGLLPQDREDFSRHLRSRYEVECTLGARRTPLTSLRAGIIVGPGGSSFRIMEKLVAKLPLMIAPKWTNSQTHPIALDDMLKMIQLVLGNEDYFGEAYDVGQREVTTYADMLRTVAELMGKKRWIIPVPVFSLNLSKLWVATIAESSSTLVSPLVESLRHELSLRPNQLMDQFPKTINFREAARQALEGKGGYPSLPPNRKTITEKNTVRSVQRLPNPLGKTAEWVARRYQTWLPSLFRYLLTAKHSGDHTVFQVAGFPLLKLQFVKDRSDDDRQLFFVVDGRLVKRKDYGWLEFRRVLDGKYVISAIHEFVPTLPWYVYVVSQALAHVWVMRRFGRYLTHLKGGEQKDTVAVGEVESSNR